MLRKDVNLKAGDFTVVAVNGEPVEDEAPDIAAKMADALREFCDRVDRDEIRSRYTYLKFKALLAEYEGLK